jgi:RNA polymerase sigma factor (sigma-70 family)
MPDKANLEYEMTLDSLQRLQRTDPRALIEWAYPHVMKRLGGGREFVRAYLHDAFADKQEKIIEGVQQAKSVGSFLSFATSCTLNRAIDLFRRQQTRLKRHVVFDEDRSESPLSEAVGDRIKPGRDEVLNFMNFTVRPVVVSSLTPKERELFDLSFGEKMTPAQIALVMQWSLGYCYKSRSELKKKVEKIFRASSGGK